MLLSLPPSASHSLPFPPLRIEHLLILPHYRHNPGTLSLHIEHSKPPPPFPVMPTNRNSFDCSVRSPLRRRCPPTQMFHCQSRPHISHRTAPHLTWPGRRRRWPRSPRLQSVERVRWAYYNAEFRSQNFIGDESIVSHRKDVKCQQQSSWWLPAHHRGRRTGMEREYVWHKINPAHPPPTTNDLPACLCPVDEGQEIRLM